MLHYHNVFDQLRNLVTMPSASDDARGGRAADGAEPAVVAGPAPGAKVAGDCAASPTRAKTDILRAWEESLAKGTPYRPVNGNGENGALATATGSMAPGSTHTANVFGKLNPGSTVVVQSCETSAAETAGQGTVVSQQTRAGSIIVAPSAMAAPRVQPRPTGLPRRHAVPEPGSLFDIIIKNPRTRLFVRPMGWVDDHTRHLGVTWRALPDADTVPLAPAALSAYYDVHDHHLDVNKIFLPCSRNEAPVSDVLPRLYPRGSLLAMRSDPFSELRLWFDSRVYRFAMRVECLWRWPFHPSERDAGASFMTESTLDAWSDGEDESPRRAPPHAGKPVLAYVGREWLKGLRSRHMRVMPGHPTNGPVARLSVLQEKQLLPADPERDPRFASILIAMAQDHVYPPCPAPGRFPGTVPPRLEVAPEFRDATVRLLVHGLDGDFTVYKATVSADYLRRFHDPLKAFASEGGPPGLEIEMTRVAESPRVGLRERLGAALGEEVVGPIFDDLVGLVRDREHTPDTERCTPETEDGSEDVTEPGSVETETNGAANGAVSHVNAPSASEARPEASPEASDSPTGSKRQRSADAPCLDAESQSRTGKKRRLSDEERGAAPLSN